jgi:hypothetical protein
MIFSDLYYSANIVRVIKSRRMRWVERVVRLEEKGGLFRVLVRNLRERDHFEDPGVDEEDNIKMDLQEVRSSWIRIGTGGGNF